MSFRDVPDHSPRRRRKHYIFDNARSPTSRTMGPIVVSLRGDYEEDDPLQETRISSKPRKQHPEVITLQKDKKERGVKERGVRPRLLLKCPVTDRRLALDDASLASGSTVLTRSVTTVDDYSIDSEHYEDPVIPAVTPSHISGRSQSIFAHLTTSVVNFQKMVAELESLLDQSGQSPEAQWRTRILLRSAQEADQDISQRLYEFEGAGREPSSSRAQVASRKLHRDFRRAHKNYTDVVAKYEKRQHVEVSFLSKQEEFFDRATRQQEEINNINTSMKHVNNIYSELAALVDGQQEKIDAIAEETEEARAHTLSGLDQIQFGIFGNLCGATGEGHESKRASYSSQPSYNNQANYRVNEEFQWSMPFETIGDDMRAVHEDILDFGRQFIEEIQDNVEQALGSDHSSCVNAMESKCPTSSEGGKGTMYYDAVDPNVSQPAANSSIAATIPPPYTPRL